MKPLSTAISKLMQSGIRVSIALAVAVALIAAISGRAFGYSCSVKHCYAVNTWTQETEYLGASTDILVVHLNCDTRACVTRQGMITNELWLVDTTTCAKENVGMCWIETGYTDYRSSKQTFFWADKRPGKPFAFELREDVAAGNYDQMQHFRIIKDGRTTPNLFQVFMYNDSSSTFFQGTSNDNAMKGNQIIIGQELYGTAGASAPQATFTHNLFAAEALGPANVFLSNAQIQLGSLTNNNPPMGGWDIAPPSSGELPEGGQFSTICC